MSEPLSAGRPASAWVLIVWGPQLLQIRAIDTTSYSQPHRALRSALQALALDFRPSQVYFEGGDFREFVSDTARRLVGAALCGIPLLGLTMRQGIWRSTAWLLSPRYPAVTRKAVGISITTNYRHGQRSSRPCRNRLPPPPATYGSDPIHSGPLSGAASTPAVSRARSCRSRISGRRNTPLDNPLANARGFPPAPGAHCALAGIRTNNPGNLPQKQAPAR